MKRTSRKPSKLPESLHQRLNSYALAASAAGVGILALAQPAEAKIVYTRTHKICPCKISLNNDGIYDFAIGSASKPGEHYGVYPVRPLIQGNRVWGAFHTSDYYRSAQWAFALRSGALIRAIPKPKGSTAMLIWEANSTGNGYFSTSFLGYWANVQRRYLGLRFIVSGKVHYGWARLSVSCPNTNCSATLTGYAYETIPDKPIVTGKTHGKGVITVEPATLGHLARGATAISTRRAKESQ